MSILTLPTARIPIGWATIKGERVPVVIDIEWMRALITLVDRAGGVTGVGTDELSMSAFEDAGIEELKAAMYSGFDDAAQFAVYPVETIDRIESELAEQAATIAEMQKEMQGLQQGAHL